MGLSKPDINLVEAIARFCAFSKSGSVSENCIVVVNSDLSLELPQFSFGDRRFVFLHAAETDSLSSIGGMLREHRPKCFDDQGILEIVVGVSGIKGDSEHANAGLGVRVETLHAALARLLRLPYGWREAQLNSLTQTLRPVLVQGQSRAVALLATFDDGTQQNAPSWVSKYLSWQDRDSRAKKLVYLRAEAGKGKSTTLADLTYSRLAVSNGPIPLFVPLRNLERGAGVSWGGIAERLGVVTADADRLAYAVQSGLVLLVLDGLDEVSGRHNPALVLQVVDLVVKRLLSRHSLVVISGRTTEGSYIEPSTAIDVNLELPEVTEKSFSDYVEIVIDEITPTWSAVSERLPEPSFDQSSKQDAARPTPGERVQIRDWITEVFEKLGKDRSLFFVQGLAWIGRSRQLHGNKALIIAGQVLEVPPIFDVCVLAASLACVREQDKIDPIARDLFTPAKQLDLLSIFAVVASIDSSQWNLATPNELAQRVFDVDPTHQNEEFSSILHQMQKHALLFSRRSEDSTGDWKPNFLSEWVRNALLIRAWRDRHRLVNYIRGGLELAELIASAREAKLAFYEVLPSLLQTEDATREIISTALRVSNAGSPEATANYWGLIAGLSPKFDSFPPPERIPELTDFSSCEFEEMKFNVGFSGSYSLFCDVEFSDCEFVDCEFVEADFSGARFVNCRFRNVKWASCSGSAIFDSCDFESCGFSASRSRKHPAWYFVESEFSNTKFNQQSVVADEAYVKACVFEECTTDAVAGSMFDGPGLGFDPRRVEGIVTAGDKKTRTSAHQCLRAVLKPFFPRRVGEGKERQSRRYIRSSALGRGVLPIGSPSVPELLQLLEVEGFASGGRSAHIYAPWSSVLGVVDKSIPLRNEFIEFMRDNREGPTIKRMIDKINRIAGWVGEKV